MFLKKNNIRIRRINLRIAALFSGLFALTSLLLFGAVFFTARASLRQGELDFIRHKILGYWALTQTSNIETFIAGLKADNILLEGTPFFLRISDAENATIFFVYPQPWKDFFPDDLETTPRNTNAILSLESPLRTYTLEMATLPLQEAYFLQIGTSSEARKKMLSLITRNFIFLFFPLLGVSFLIGAFLTARTLNPIKRLAEAARTIVDTGSLRERIPASSGRDELQDLVLLFNRMLDRIETLVRGMRGTLDTVAHDLRTPLARLRGTAELALSSPDDAGRYKEALEDGLEESERILTMLNAIMDISEAETGTLRLEPVLTDAAEIVRDVADLYSFIAEERSIALEVRTPEQLNFRLDIPRFRQVVGNLLDNAVKYSLDKGTIHVELTKDTDSLRLQVTDTGEGIREDEIVHIWERLYRGSLAREKPGLGIGLSLVMAIVEAHGGTVSAANRPEGGASFEIRIPETRPGQYKITKL